MYYGGYGDKDKTNMYISIPSEKVEDSPYPCPVNAEISRQNEDGFVQYLRGQVYLPSLGT